MPGRPSRLPPPLRSPEARSRLFCQDLRKLREVLRLPAKSGLSSRHSSQFHEGPAGHRWALPARTRAEAGRGSGEGCPRSHQASPRLRSGGGAGEKGGPRAEAPTGTCSSVQALPVLSPQAAADASPARGTLASPAARPSDRTPALRPAPLGTPLASAPGGSGGGRAGPGGVATPSKADAPPLQAPSPLAGAVRPGQSPARRLAHLGRGSPWRAEDGLPIARLERRRLQGLFGAKRGGGGVSGGGAFHTPARSQAPPGLPTRPPVRPKVSPAAAAAAVAAPLLRTAPIRHRPPREKDSRRPLRSGKLERPAGTSQQPGPRALRRQRGRGLGWGSRRRLPPATEPGPRCRPRAHLRRPPPPRRPRRSPSPARPACAGPSAGCGAGGRRRRRRASSPERPLRRARSERSGARAKVRPGPGAGGAASSPRPQLQRLPVAPSSRSRPAPAFSHLPVRLASLGRRPSNRAARGDGAPPKGRFFGKCLGCPGGRRAPASTAKPSGGSPAQAPRLQSGQAVLLGGWAAAVPAVGL